MYLAPHIVIELVCAFVTAGSLLCGPSSIGTPQHLTTSAEPTAIPRESTSDASPTGSWLGALEIGPQTIRLGLIIEARSDGVLVARLRQLDPRVTERPIPVIAREGTTLRFSLEQPKASFVGTLHEGHAELKGTWTQKGRDFPLTFQRVESLPGDRRPQEPLPPLPYAEVNVELTPVPSITLAGTLTIPASASQGPAARPAVLLLSGSGAQDRDESAFGHRPFLVLADSLCRRGFVVLRLDDRGVGGSTGDTFQATLDDRATDAIAALEFLAARPEVDATKITLVGHSEGGLVAALTAHRSRRVARIICLNTPVIPVRELKDAQTASIGASLGASPAAIEAIQGFHRELFDALTRGLEGDAFTGHVTTAREQLLRAIPDGERPHYLQLVDELVAGASGYATPWFRSLLALKPDEVIRAVRCPITLVFGGRDVQVAATVNSERSRALAETRERAAAIDVVVFPALNHMLQTAETGAMSEYALIEETIAQSLLELIAERIARQ